MDLRNSLEARSMFIATCVRQPWDARVLSDFKASTLNIFVRSFD